MFKLIRDHIRGLHGFLQMYCKILESEYSNVENGRSNTIVLVILRYYSIISLL